MFQLLDADCVTDPERPVSRDGSVLWQKVAQAHQSWRMGHAHGKIPSAQRWTPSVHDRLLAAGPLNVCVQVGWSNKTWAGTSRKLVCAQFGWQLSLLSPVFFLSQCKLAMTSYIRSVSRVCGSYKEHIRFLHCQIYHRKHAVFFVAYVIEA